MKKRGLVYGVGINDADYNVYKTAKVDGKRKVIWTCPFFAKWSNMIERCYDEKCQIRHPSYVGCYTVPEWHYFMTFRTWMIEQDWEGKELDKDILFPGNKVYGPDTCVFVTRKVNNFLVDAKATRGEWPVGVDFHKRTGKFRASCNNVITGYQDYLGIFDSADKAHQVWLEFKLKQAKILASQQTDERVAKALVSRYENYEKFE